MTQHFEQNKNMVLHEDNVYLLGDRPPIKGEYFCRGIEIHKCHQVHDEDIEFKTEKTSVYCGYNTFHPINACKAILYTTDPSLQGLKQLPREMFVRPFSTDKFIEDNKPYTDKVLNEAYANGVCDGYNANKGEFTMEDMADAMESASNWLEENPNKSIHQYIPVYINRLVNLSLPQSLTIENDVITKINW